MYIDSINDEYGDFLVISDVQKILHISKNTVYLLIRNGSLDHFKVGKKYRIPKQSLLNYVNKDLNTTN